MISFENDYSEGAHPKVLEALVQTNLEQLPGYGTDRYSESAKRKIQEAAGCPGADVFFLSGGTETNQLVISSLLKSYEGVIAAVSGHVNQHEAGAIEHSGHKVLALPEHEGKLSAEEVETLLRTFYGDENHEHMVFPGMVYISHPTEYGTLYSKAELAALRAVCDAFGILLYVDGARLGYGLMSHDTDVSLKDLAAYADVFYIGGTKCGALIGEALVFPKGNAPAHYPTIIKQHGAMLAKGRIVSIQFDALFTDGLYEELSRYAIDMADRLKALLHEMGCRFYLESPTNQQFIILKKDELEKLKEDICFSFWEWLNEEDCVIRLVTNWATTEAGLAELRRALERSLR